MERFTTLTATAAPLLRANVDTDAIIPSREIKTVGKTGLADGLFAGWRYTAPGGREPDPGFVLNRQPFNTARILITGENFGCGSSREHAVWALHEYGFRAVIAPSFAPIFQSNCTSNGIVPAVVSGDHVQLLATAIERDPAQPWLTIDLDAQTIASARFAAIPFQIDPAARLRLLEGLDAITLSLAHQQDIEAFLARDTVARPWIYLEGT
jgi:3-isopropylmalate/(R)-2-methylmalate dehydratase small subunit